MIIDASGRYASVQRNNRKITSDLAHAALDKTKRYVLSNLCLVRMYPHSPLLRLMLFCAALRQRWFVQWFQACVHSPPAPFLSLISDNDDLYLINTLYLSFLRPGTETREAETALNRQEPQNPLPDPSTRKHTPVLHSSLTTTNSHLHPSPHSTHATV